MLRPVEDLEGMRGTLRWVHFFIFMQFLANIMPNNSLVPHGFAPHGKPWIRHSDIKGSHYLSWETPQLMCFNFLIDVIVNFSLISSTVSIGAEV